eukprot:s245_g9.t1
MATTAEGATAPPSSAHRGEEVPNGGEPRRSSHSTDGTVDDFVRVTTDGLPGDVDADDGDPWATGQDPWSRWWDSDPWQWGDWQGSWQWRQQDWWDGRDGKGKDFADPPAWPGWGSNYRLWRRAIVRWNQATDVAVNRGAERIFKSMEWDLQAKFEHLDDATLTGELYLDYILEILDVLAGEKQATEMRRTVRKALFEGSRKSEESIAQFALRREQEFAMAERYVSLPNELKGIMLEEHAGLGKQGTLNLRTLTGGSNDFQVVSKALKILDLEEEGIVQKGKSSHFVGMTDEKVDGAEDDEEFEVSSLCTDDEKEILAEIEKLDVDEKAALEIFASIEREKRTWKENKKLKLAQKKDRRHFADRESRPYGGSGHKSSTGRPRRSANIDAIKKVSRCSNCGERGHWAEDCKKPYRSKAERLEQERASKENARSSAFVFLGDSSNASGSSYVGGPSYYIQDYDMTTDDIEGNSTWAMTTFVGMALPGYVRKVLDGLKTAGSGDSFLSIPAGHAIIDPGAGQDLIGKPAYELLQKKLRKVGLQPVPIEDDPGRASGIGGQANTLFMALVPTILGGTPGIVRLTVVEEDVPHLLSIGLLESAGSIIDTKSNIIQYLEHGTQDKMHRLKSGHRTVDITKWDGDVFPVPQQVRDQYGLTEGAFNTKSVPSEESYMCEPPQGGDWHAVEGTPFVFKIHETPMMRLHVPTLLEAGHLEGLRISVRVHSNGSISHQVDDWKVDGPVSECSTPWTGMSIFCQRDSGSTSGHIGRSFMSHGVECPELSGSSVRWSCTASQFEALPTPHASTCRSAMDAPGGSAAGEALPREEAGGDRQAPLSSSSAVHRGGQQSVWTLASLPEVQDQDRLQGTFHSPREDEEGQGRRVRPRLDIHGYQGGSQQSEGCGEETAPGGDAHADGSGQQLWRGTPTDSDAIESPASDGPQLSPVTSHLPLDDGSECPHGADTAESEQPGNGHADGAAGAGEHDSCDDSDDRTHAGAPRRRGLGCDSCSTTSAVNLEVSSGPSTACRPMFHRLLRQARCENYITEENEVRVAWEIPELFTYLEDEDITDDYEAGVSTGVRKAVKRVLAGADLSPRCREDFDEPLSDDAMLASDSSDDSGPEIEKFKVMELFSPPRVTAAIIEGHQRGRYQPLVASVPPAYDLETGWDFFNAADRKQFWVDLEREDPDLVLMTPECRGFSSLQNINWDRMDPVKRKELETRAMTMLQFCVQVAEHRLRRGKFFGIEQPDRATSWNTYATQWLSRQREVMHIAFDQCAAGLQVDPAGPSRKRTALMVNHLGVADSLARLQCPGNHVHVPLDHGLPHRARIWPDGLVRAVLDGILEQLLWSGVAERPAQEGEDEAAEEEEAMEDEPELPARAEQEQPLSQAQKDMIRRLHINMGHLPKDRMLVMLKAAKAQNKVIRYVRDELHCEECMRQRREVRRRAAAYPRTFEFNRIVGVDTFFVKFNGKKIPFLNIVCHGSNWQAVCMVRPLSGGEPSGGNPSSEETWKCFLNAWIRPHGAPEVVISDGGMEFKGRFERALEQHSILQSVTDLQSPWQNGRAERHGQWVKDRMDLAVGEGDSVVESLNDLEEIATELVASKNCWFSRGGYSPAQLVYGRNPRVPAELLSDADQSSPGWSDILCDPSEMDNPAFEFRRSYQIRDRAKKLAMEHLSKEKIRDAGRPPLHRQRTWAPGQWVLVWRTARGGERSRWIGPGLVILQNDHTVYVAMRSRLWKCSSDQLRPVSSTEELAMQVVTSEQYKDLLQQMRGQRVGAVDVAREGAPPAEGSGGNTPEEANTTTPARFGRGPSDQEDAHDTGPDPAPSSTGATQGTGVGHSLRNLERGSGDGASSQAPPAVVQRQIQAHRVSRRGSLETVSEPQSEPPGGSLSARSEDSEAKRRRLSELRSIQEEPTLPAGRDPGEVSAEAETPIRPGRPEAETPSGSDTVRNDAWRQSVRERVTEIETRPHMRRRSRSPLPEVLRRQRERPPDSSSMFQTEYNDWSDIDKDQEPDPIGMGNYKAACIFYNQGSAATDHLVLGEENLFMLATAENDHSEVYAGEPVRNGEITWSQMTPEEKLQFEAADLKEWDSLEKEFQAVKVWRGEEAARLRMMHPDRIMTSRMVRRKKPVPGLHQYKAKSRFCVHGHKDPDSGTYRTFAPTPSTEALHMTCQVVAKENLLLAFGDIKAAFAQSDRLCRPQGRLFVQPCEGTPLDPADLVELIAPVYGLDDAPIRWHATASDFVIKDLRMKRSLLDPCIFTRHNASGQLEALILMEVDDFMIAAKNQKILKELQDKLQNRFCFGKWETQSAEFIGRRIVKSDTEVKLDQQKYILEKLEAVNLSKGRRADKASELSEQEFKDFRSMLYRVSWVAHQTRPEAAGTVSILSSQLHKANIGDVILLNKLIGHLRSTATQGIRLRSFNSKEMTFVGISDAGGVDGEVRGWNAEGLPDDPVQGAWMVLASNMLPAHDRKIPVSVLSWRSSKLKRRVTSTMASETMALSQCLGEIEWLQVLFRDLVFGDVQTKDWRRSLSPFMVFLPEECELKARQNQCSVTDAKSLYDALYKMCPASRQDRRTALELAVIVDLLQKTGSQIRWTPHPRMPVDTLTKADISKGNGALLHLLRNASLRIEKEETELHRRQNEAVARSRTRRASERMLETEEDLELAYFLAALSNGVWPGPSGPGAEQVRSLSGFRQQRHNFRIFRGKFKSGALIFRFQDEKKIMAIGREYRNAGSVSWMWKRMGFCCLQLQSLSQEQDEPEVSDIGCM